jgi:RHS repeat-associated protein
MVGQYDSGTPGLSEVEGWAYHHPDALGSVRQLSDATGQVTLARSYTPFGAPLSQVGTGQGSFGYAGEQRDASAGLTFLRARYYDPATGRFLTRDPYPAYATVPGALHRYAYVGNDPVGRVDPSGLQWAPRAGTAIRRVSPRLGGAPYDTTAAMAGRVAALGAINAYTQAQSRGHRQAYCGPTGMLGRLWDSVRRGTLLPDLFHQGVHEMRTNPFWRQRIPREEGLRMLLGVGIAIGATVVTGGAAAPAILWGAGIGAGIGYGAQVVGNYLQGLGDAAWTTNIDPWGILRGGLYGMVSGAVAGALEPVLPVWGSGLGRVLETGAVEFVGGRATQVAANLLAGQPWDANLGNPLDIALDVLPGMAVAGLGEACRAVRARDIVGTVDGLDEREIVVLYRFADSPEKLRSPLGRAVGLEEYQAIVESMSLDELRVRAGQHSRGVIGGAPDIIESPFVATLRDYKVGSITRDPRLNSIINESEYRYTLAVPRNRVFVPGTEIGRKDTEEMVLAYTVEVYVTKKEANPFKGTLPPIIGGRPVGPNSP